MASSLVEAGLSTPLNPFIVELLERTNEVSAELWMNATRILVPFITLYQALSFVPTIDLLRYFTHQAVYGSVQAN